MTATGISIRALLIDDDKETLDGMMASLPVTFAGHDKVELDYEPCLNFEEGQRRVKRHSYDLVITDFYKDSKKETGGFLPQGQSEVPGLVKSVRSGKFCPVIIFSSRAKPDNVKFGPFVLWADKSAGDKEVKARIVQVLDTGIPQAARHLRDEVDGLGGKYLWDFLEKEWEQLGAAGLVGDRAAMDRMVRRRASVQLAHFEGEVERDSIHGFEYYLIPRVSDKEYRLGEIVKHKKSGGYLILLTPHCHLRVQSGENAPRAEFVLAVEVLPATQIVKADYSAKQQKEDSKTEDKKRDRVRRWIQSPAQLGKPAGRYWFLPSFLAFPDSFCDFMRAFSVPLAELQKDFEPVMVLDAPYAEAMQACFGAFYSDIGLANLNPASYLHMFPA